jgi:hypothetical protein
MITIMICPQCKVDFVPVGRSKNRPRKYCSRPCYELHKTLPLAERFWVKVEKSDGCWLWTGSRTKGYGYIARDNTGNPGYAHRISWEIRYGPIRGNLCVLHKCDTPLCVRPDHLFLGTKSDNAKDCVSKGRWIPPKLRGQGAPL